MKKNIGVLLLAIIGFLGYPLHVVAQGIKNSGKQLQKVANKAGTGEADLSVIVGTIINVALSLVGIIFLILMVYAGLRWMTARGVDEEITKSKEIIKASIIGLVITVSAYAITIFVTGKLGQ